MSPKSPTSFHGFFFLMGFTFVLTAAADEQRVSFHLDQNHLEIRVGDRPFADYVFRDEKIPRPYFHNMYAPNGGKVTRNHPPIQGKDIDDHPTYHPGVWLAFGDISGADFWRNKATVRHEEFVRLPFSEPRKGAFAVRNRYEAGGKTICIETSRYTILVEPSGYFLLWDSTFKGDAEFFFGDQEEMGLGVRVASEITVKRGGRIVNSEGLENEKNVWGKQSLWCDYSGMMDGKHFGVTLMPHPENFRRCWFHARDYGLLLANPFGRKAFHAGPESKVVVKSGESIRLRFGIFLHGGTGKNPPDIPAAYKRYLEAIR